MNLKLLQKEQFKKTAEATSGFIVNKVDDKITKVWKTSPQSNSETVTNDHDKNIPKERYTSPEEREKIIDDLRLI